MKNVFLKFLQYSQKSTRIFIEKKIPALFQLYWKETPTQVCYCKYSKISMNAYFEDHVSGSFRYILRISLAGLLQNLRTPDSLLSVQQHWKHEMF